MKNLRIITISLISLVSLFLFAPKASAQEFNGQIRNWTTETNPALNYLQTSGSTLGTLTSTDLNNFCQNELFRFQQNNLFVGTFCDLGSIVAISAADFATNVTCSIQSVSMSNYSDSIRFGTTAGTGGACPVEITGNGAITGTSPPDVFGTGSAFGTTGGASTNNSTPGTGLYAPRVMSQLSTDISEDGWIRNGFELIRNFATILALIFLIIFAFANILHIDINTYTIKKMIPNIIFAVIGSYLSIYVIILLSRGVDFLYRLEFFSPYNALHPYYNIMGGSFGGQQIANGPDQNIDALRIIFGLGGSVMGGAGDPSIISGIIGIVVMSVPAVVAFAFEYVLALRPIAIGLLTVLSPVAFAAYLFPTGQNIFKKWVSIMLIALFYTPAVNLILYLINQIPPPGNEPLLMLVGIVVKTAIFAFLIRMPFTIETDIQKISLALSKTSFGAGLGLGKAGTQDVKVKQENKNPVADKILESKAAKSLIAPVSNAYRHDIKAARVESNNNKKTLSSYFNQTKGPLIKNIDAVSDKAHQNNLLRTTGLLVSSIADLSPEALRKIATSSNIKLAHDPSVIQELKQKNGQLLDDEGAMTRADAGRKAIRAAEIFEQGKIKNPEAVKLLSQKQMLDLLPIEILKKSLEQGIINKDDLRANFKGNPDEVANKISSFSRGKILSSAEFKLQAQKDFTDSKTGFTDLLQAIQSNITQRPDQARSNIVRTIESAKNQGDFDKNGYYYLSRLHETKNEAKEKLETSLKQAGTPAQTAVAIAQNPSLNYEQISSYIPKTAPAQTLQIIRESIAQRDSAQAMTGQISSSLKEDKVMLGRAIAEKVSESLNKGTTRSFDDVKSQITSTLQNLNSNSSPQEIKTAASQLNTFTPVAQMQTAMGSTPEEIDKLKNKGEAVISTINEMRASGVDEKTLKENPQKAVEQFSSSVQDTINKVATGQVNMNPQPNQRISNSNNQAVKENQIPNSSQITDTMNKVLSSDGKNGNTFDQKLTDISKNKPQAEPKPQAGAANG